MYSINVPSNNDTYSVSFSNEELFKKYQFWQRSLLCDSHEGTSHQLGYNFSPNIDANIQNFYSDLWRHCLNRKIYNNLPVNPTILDIGSGTSVIDFLAYQYLGRQAKFYLLDKEETGGGKEYFSKNYGFYHHWETVKDAIETSGFNKEDFVLLNPEDQWSEKFDLITSWASWPFHYPLSVYWDRVKESLKVNGKLVIDISIFASKETDVISIISEEFQSDPLIIPLMSKLEGYYKNHLDPVATGHRCIWIRKK